MNERRYTNPGMLEEYDCLYTVVIISCHCSELSDWNLILNIKWMTMKRFLYHWLLVGIIYRSPLHYIVASTVIMSLAIFFLPCSFCSVLRSDAMTLHNSPGAALPMRSDGKNQSVAHSFPMKNLQQCAIPHSKYRNILITHVILGASFISYHWRRET